MEGLQLRLFYLLHKREQILRHLAKVFFSVARVLRQGGAPYALILSATQLLLIVCFVNGEGGVEADSGNPTRLLSLQSAVQKWCVGEVLRQDEVLIASLCQATEPLQESVGWGEGHRELQLIEDLILHLYDLFFGHGVVGDSEQVLELRWVYFLVLASDVQRSDTQALELALL